VPPCVVLHRAPVVLQLFVAQHFVGPQTPALNGKIARTRVNAARGGLASGWL